VQFGLHLAGPQCPFSHTDPPMHTCPHVPQFSPSVSRLTQSPLQQVWELVHWFWQSSWQVGAVNGFVTQLCPAGQGTC